MINNKICLSGNFLKVIAAVSMLIDHTGLILFPGNIFLRIIGRISFPIFAFMISEGCYHTRNKIKYFLGIFLLSLLCQGAYFVFDKRLDMCVLVTFSLSILLIYAMDYFKDAIFNVKCSAKAKYLSFAAFLLSLAAVCILNIYFDIDYGFWGCMLPVFASVFRNRKNNSYAFLNRFDKNIIHVIMLGVGACFVSVDLGGIQGFSLFAIPVLMFYSGKRGKLEMKWFFYVFYPLHLVVLQIINMFV